MNHTIWVGRTILASADPSQNLRFPRCIYPKTTFLRFLHHPIKRDLRQRTFAFRISTPHVAVHACKPDLLQVLRPARSSRSFGQSPKMIPEKCSMFVYCYCVAPNFYVGIICNEGQLERICYPSDRAHRVPDANEPRVAAGARHRV